MKGEKERAKRRKGGEEKNALLFFIIATVEIVFGRKTAGRQSSIWR